MRYPERAKEIAERLPHAVFFTDRYARVFNRGIRNVIDSGRPPDFEAVRLILQASGDFAEVTARTFYAIDDGIPRSQNIDYVIEQLLGLWLLRSTELTLMRSATLLREDPAIIRNGFFRETRTALETLEQEAQQHLLGIVASPFRSPEDLVHAERVKWTIPGFVAIGGITELTGQAKRSGKTTLISFWAECAIAGADCFGVPVLQTPVVFLTEQTAASFQEVLRRSGLLHRHQGQFRYLSYHDVKGHRWPTIAEMAGAEADRIGASIVIVDTLPMFAGIKGDAENNAGDAQDALAPLQQLAHRGKAIVVTRHARKAGGDVGEDGRGSSAFTGGVDIVLSLKRPPGNQSPALRVLEALSRFDETPAQLVIEKVSVSRPDLGIEVWADSYRVIGDVEAAATDSAKLALRDHLPFTEMEALTEDDLISATGSTRSAVQRALRLFPDVSRIGTGKKGNPFRYFRQRKDSAQTLVS